LKRILITFLSLILLVLSFTDEARAQKKKVQNLPAYDLAPYHFGFILGLNQMLFAVKPVENLPFIKWDSEELTDDFFGADSGYVYSVTSTPSPGFTIGILGNLRTGKYTDLRFIPSLSFGERVLNYDVLVYRDGDEPLFVSTQKSITSTLIDFPLEFKYKSKRLNNMRGYVLVGAAYTLDLASQSKAERESDNFSVKINKHDLLLSAGVGFDFYTNYFKFGTQLKMSYGFNNMIKYEDNMYTNSIESLRSKVFLLSFTFE
jgi:hypothetical protein